MARRVGRPGRVRGEREAESRRGKSRPGAGSGPGREQGRGGWWRGRAVRSRGRGPGRCSAAFGKEGGEGRKERGEEKKEKEEKKRKEKENGKKKKKKEGKEKGKREGEVLAGITALIAEPVGHAWRPGARERDAQVEGKQGAGYGCRVFGESGDPAGQGGFRKTGVRVLRRDRAQRRETKF